MVVWLFCDTRRLDIYQALKILAVNIYNCYKKTMTFLIELFFWYNPTAIPLPRPLNLSRLLKMTQKLLYRMILSPLLLLWNTIMLYDILQIHFFDRSIKSLTFYETSWCIRPWLCCLVAKTNTSPNDSLNSFNRSTYWSFKKLQSCYQNAKCIFGVYPWKVGDWKSSVSHITSLGRVSLAKSYTRISLPREENRVVNLPTL